MLLFCSCEVPKEKVIIKEEVKTSVDSTINIKKEPVSQEYIYSLYGCLNKDNLMPNGENKFILKVKENNFPLIWKYVNGDCGLEDDIYSNFNKFYFGPLPLNDKERIVVSFLNFSCNDLEVYSMVSKKNYFFDYSKFKNK